MKTILFDASRCNGCYNCQIACKDEHCQQPWLPYTEAQALTGEFWCKLTQRDRGRVPMVWVEYKPLICGHCDNCKLLEAAPGELGKKQLSEFRKVTLELAKKQLDPLKEDITTFCRSFDYRNASTPAELGRCRDSVERSIYFLAPR